MLSENGILSHDSANIPHKLISEELVTKTLRADKGSEVTLKSFTVKDFTKKGDNYVCFVTSVIVNYSEAGKEEREVTYVVKCNPCSKSSASKQFMSITFEKEARCYGELVPLLNRALKSVGLPPLKLATCYNFYLKLGEEIILLNDLRKDDYKMFDRKKGLDKEHMTLILEELGRFHAASVIAQEEITEPLEEKFDFLKKDFFEMFDKTEVIFPDFLRHFLSSGISMLEKIGGYSKAVDWLHGMKPSVGDVFEELVKQCSPFNVVCHGDCWNNNLLFRYDEKGIPVDIRLLDLQICRKASPATDLNYLMYTSVNGADRKANLNSFLDTYHSSFSNVLKTAKLEVPFDLKELRKEYHEKNLFGLLMGMMVVPLVVSEGDVLDFNAIGDGEVESFMNDCNEKFLERLESNPLLRPRMLSMFDEMIEYGVIT